MNKFFKVFIALNLFFLIGCKEDATEIKDDSTVEDSDYILLIENGAQVIAPTESISYSAILVDSNGEITPATGITWSVDKSQADVATISSSGKITAVGLGEVTVTASATVNDKNLTASVPLGIYAPSVFTVAPSAIIFGKGESLPLEAVHLSKSGIVNPTCTFESSNPSVASVNGSGQVSFVDVGECVITVTATSLDGQPTVKVPVIVVGLPEISLPVINVEVNPAVKDLFKDETQQLTAKAFNAEGGIVSDAVFTWRSLNPAIAEVSSTGVVTPKNPGKAYIQAQTSGIIGQAEITVYPDTIVLVEPIFASISPGHSKQFTATAYKVTRSNATPYSDIVFDWTIPTFGFSIFDIATINSDGLVTIKDSATPGLPTFVRASVKGNPSAEGVGTITVGIADDCDCGIGNESVSRIEVSNSQPISLNMFTGDQVQLTVTAYDDFDDVVADPGLVYCSSNELVCTVDESGLVIPVGEGEATIKICSGDYAETTAKVNVVLF